MKKLLGCAKIFTFSLLQLILIVCFQCRKTDTLYNVIMYDVTHNVKVQTVG